MKCSVDTVPSSPAYVTNVKCVSDHTSHSLPSRYFENRLPGSASWKQVIRPFWLLAPKPPRKYPLTVMSPNLGRAGGGADGGVAPSVGAITGDGVSAALGSSVLCSVSVVSVLLVSDSEPSCAKAGWDASPVNTNPDNPSTSNVRRMRWPVPVL